MDRAKWGRLAKFVFKTGAWLTARFADDLVFDSREIERRWKRRVSTRRAVHPLRRRCRGLASLGGRTGASGYVLAVARFVPENTIPEFLEAAERIATTHPVVIVGSSGYGGPLDEEARRLAEANPRFTRSVTSATTSDSWRCGSTPVSTPRPQRGRDQPDPRPGNGHGHAHRRSRHRLQPRGPGGGGAPVRARALRDRRCHPRTHGRFGRAGRSLRGSGRARFTALHVDRRLRRLSGRSAPAASCLTSRRPSSQSVPPVPRSLRCPFPLAPSFSRSRPTSDRVIWRPSSARSSGYRMPRASASSWWTTMRRVGP